MYEFLIQKGKEREEGKEGGGSINLIVVSVISLMQVKLVLVSCICFCVTACHVPQWFMRGGGRGGPAHPLACVYDQLF
jgi:hypothetical protein